MSSIVARPIFALRARHHSVSMSDPAVFEEVESREAAPESGHDDAALWPQVESLPEKQRQAVILYYQDERTVEEVAAMMGMPVNTVKTHLHRARAALAVALDKSGQEGS